MNFPNFLTEPPFFPNGVTLLRIILKVIVFHFSASMLTAQVAPADSMALISILDQNCSNCQLGVPTSRYYWDRQTPVGTWPGVSVRYGRIDSLAFENTGLTGNLPGLQALDALRHLDLGGGPDSIPTLAGLNQLESLRIRRNGRLNALPSLDHLKCLRYLEISDNRNLAGLPSLDSLHNLEMLNCRRNGLTTLPDLGGCHQLRVLNCINNRLQRLPNLQGCEALEELHYAFNDSFAQPDLSDLNSLRLVNCSNTHLSALDPDLLPTALEGLDCKNNLLQVLPALDRLVNLKVLSLENNQLSEFPLSPLVNNPNLIALNLSNNHLDTVPSLDGLPALRYLNVNYNNIRGMAPLNHPQLSYLYCGSNAMQALPAMNRVPQLKVLAAGHMALESFPSLVDCPELTGLWCIGNALPDLPELHPQAAMKFAFMSNNQLTFEDLEPWYDLIEMHTSGTFHIIGPQVNLSWLINAGTDVPGDFEFNDTNTPIMIYGGQDSLRLAPRDSIAALQGDTLLDASIAGGQFSQYQWFRDTTALPNATSPYLTAAEATGNGVYHCEVTNTRLPDLTLASHPVFVFYDAGITCGDVNLDGVTNMLDFAQVALNLDATGPARQSDGNGDRNVPAFDWVDSLGAPRSFMTLDGRVLNLKHADADGNGIVDGDDLDCIRTHYDALRLPAVLTNVIGDTIQLKAIPQQQEIRLVDGGKVEIPFRIVLSELPAGMDSLLLKGLVFTKPIAHSEGYRVDAIRADLLTSAMFDDPGDSFGMMAFLEDMSINLGDYPEYPCLNVSVAPLDVGLFNRRDTVKNVGVGDLVVRCIVTLEDVFRAIQGGINDTTHLPIVPVIGQNINVLLFISKDRGRTFRPIATSCASDTTYVDTDSLFRTIRGQVRTAAGQPLAGIEVELSGDTLQAMTTGASGHYAFAIREGADYEIQPMAPETVDPRAGIDHADASAVWRHVLGSTPLSTPWARIAADVNGSGSITFVDFLYIKLMAWGLIRSFPGGRTWEFVPADHVFANPLDPFPFPRSRQHPNALAAVGQDFVGIRLGDVNSSYNGASRLQPAQKPDAPEPERNLALRDTVGLQPLEVPDPKLALRCGPNPVITHAHFIYELPAPGHARIQLHDLRGKPLRTWEGHHAAGEHRITWDVTTSGGGRIAEGVYILRLATNDTAVHKKIIVTHR